MTERLFKALSKLSDMKAPSVPKILYGRQFTYEARQVQEVMDAFEETRQVKPELEEAE